MDLKASGGSVGSALESVSFGSNVREAERTLLVKLKIIQSECRVRVFLCSHTK